MIVKWLETPIGQKNDRKGPFEFHEICLVRKIKRYYLAFNLTRRLALPERNPKPIRTDLNPINHEERKKPYGTRFGS